MNQKSDVTQSNSGNNTQGADLQELLNQKTQESLKHIALEIKHYSYLIKRLLPGEQTIRHSF